MRMYDIIMKKRNGYALTKEEIIYFVQGFSKGEIPDYQAAALLMAIYFQKMNYEETLNLTLAMADSGDILDLSAITGIKADKHSTGGVGDKTSLVLGPMVASLGVKMAKMSGRGLGHTGGTIDKLESFPGFSVALTEENFIRNVNTVGLAITGQTGNLAPADKKLYALRDVTATVDNISLIAASIMSKKLAAGADVIVLDVKTGSGAFMKTEADAVELAQEMVQIGKGAGRNTIAVVSDMDEPLGYAVGNALEVAEAIDTLKGEGPKDLYALCLALGSRIVAAAGKAKDEEEAEALLKESVRSGAALCKFKEWIAAQGGETKDIEHFRDTISAKHLIAVPAEQDGYVSKIQSEDIGNASMLLGGGRETKEDIIDLSVGIVIHKKVGDFVRKGESLATLYANDEKKAEIAKQRVAAAYRYAKEPAADKKLIRCIVR